MLIGVPREIKTREYRVGMTPAGVRALVDHGHRVLVETGAGEGSGLQDDVYVRAGATIVGSAADAWGAEMVVKVKEPLAAEYPYFRKGLVLYTYLHLAAEPELTRELARTGVHGVAYETIQLDDGSLPLLRPMSEVAGKMSVQVGASCLEKERGGKGVLLGGVPGTRRGRVVILGGGVVGRNAATIAIGMGAQVTVLDVRAETMAYLEDVFGGAIETLYSNAANIEAAVERADLVVGAVLLPGAKAPRLVTRELIGRMEKGSVVVDVAVDQGGCIETCRPTTHDNPTYEVDGVVHYCVANMPGAVSHTSTWALTNVTVPYAIAIANKGLETAAKADRAVLLGINTYGGGVTYGPVATAHRLEHVPVDKALG
ncbi:alanine dehydrogenase [Chondromyces apiculatus]|uniref:Alanine dehydrogenase n=1 Tax=Chondromyces apiculatus DSM 436 TaxID=1192034 RepID=A0A017T472_9BACT|nr:alanine dehydrogenase [Chondromyces apiculatus]EYF03600.1 Alanine dehydrogenase [Chondromyces apiculatus DSM 436]